MRNHRILLVFTLLLISVSIEGCNKKLEPESTLLPLVASPLATFESVLATPTMPPSSVAVPSPSPGMGVIVGEIIDLQTQQAPLEGTVYLGNVVSLDNGRPIVRLDRKTASFAIPAQDGRFIFGEIKPGKYGLVLDTPDISFLIDNSKDGKSLLFTVEPDQILDLGRIEVLMP